MFVTLEFTASLSQSMQKKPDDQWYNRSSFPFFCGLHIKLIQREKKGKEDKVDREYDEETTSATGIVKIYYNK